MFLIREVRNIKKLKNCKKKKKLVITPLAYIRGRSLSNSFFIIDEAQNLTPHEIKTIITRAGEGTKMIFTGDLATNRFAISRYEIEWVGLYDRSPEKSGNFCTHQPCKRGTQLPGRTRK